MSTFGEISLQERTFLQESRLIRPFSAVAGVSCRGYSEPVQRRLTDFGIEKSFAKAAEPAKEQYGIDIGASTVRRITEQPGAQVLGNAAIIYGPARDTEVEQLTAQTDGSMVPKVEIDDDCDGDRRKTRTVGWKEVRLTLLYADGTVDPVYGITCGSPADVGAQRLAGAQTAGLGSHTRVHCVGDGAPWIANQMEEVFGGNGHFLVDFYHTCDYLDAASKAGSPTPESWFELSQARMKTGAIDAVYKSLIPYLVPREVDDNAAPVRACHRYLENRPGQLDYLHALENNLPIGSGRIESGHRHVIQERLKIAGAWWRVENADKVLALRVLRANGNWERLWHSRAAAARNELTA
jgi:hypothetical protein